MSELKPYIEGQEIEPYGRPRVYMTIEDKKELEAYREFGNLTQMRALCDKYHLLLDEYHEIRKWKSDVVEGFCKYDASSIEELVGNVRNKAIDEFMNKLCDHCMQQTNECYKLECPFCTDGCDIVNIAEQMKEVRSNGN